ncbi:MAG TPA: glycosyltransferase family 2 protein [Rhizomicrobium sp.]
MTPFFSVVIPVYNRAAELRTALLSVLTQTEKDFEVIIVDDGSLDDPKSAIGEIGDARISVLARENRGGPAARNAGIDAARGRFVAFLDSDDKFLPGHLAAMRLLLAGTKDVAGYAPIVVDRGKGRRFLKPPRALAPGEHIASYVLCERGFVPTITLVVEREWARRVRYDEQLSFAQDTDFCIRLFLGGCRFVMAKAPGAVWNDLGDSCRISAGRKGARMIEWLERIKPDIPHRAYHGARGWMVAKGVAQSHPFLAWKLWFAATRRGCYRPRLAVVVLLQIFVPDRMYRKLADFLIGACRGNMWSRSDRFSQHRPAL